MCRKLQKQKLSFTQCDRRHQDALRGEPRCGRSEQPVVETRHGGDFLRAVAKVLGFLVQRQLHLAQKWKEDIAQEKEEVRQM